MQHAEVGLLTEVGLLKLGMSRVLSNQLLDQSFVGGFREPALFVDNCQKTNGLKE